MMDSGALRSLDQAMWDGPTAPSSHGSPLHPVEEEEFPDDETEETSQEGEYFWRFEIWRFES